MTDCTEALSLVEKLADKEASAAEKRAAESHLTECSSCRSHLEFLLSLSKEARSMSFPEPPDAYWEHLPRRVLDRIETEAGRTSRGRFFRILLASSTLRWGALGATLLVLATFGISVLREDSRTLAPPGPPAAMEARQPEVRVSVEPGAPPPMARDEPAPEPAKRESEVVSGEDDRADTIAMPAAAPEESASAFEARDVSGAPDPRELEKQNALTLESANRPRAAAAPARLARGVALENCEGLRRAADSIHEGPERAEVLYRLATCSLGRHEREPDDELRKLAIEDAEAFLAVEGAGPRADEIRERLDRARRH